MPNKGISNELMTALTAHTWPGNIREFIGVLENVLSAAGTSSTLYSDHLPVAIRANIAKASVISGKKTKDTPVVPSVSVHKGMLISFKQYREQTINDAEQRYLGQLMDETGWNVKEACRVSDLSRPRLYALLKKHGISREK